MENKKITFEDIQKANETIKTMTIKRTDKKTGEEISKEYAEVNQRIKAFRMVYPTGFIHTKMINNENGICVFYAECGYYTDHQINAENYLTDTVVLATGTAQEKESSSFINQTSYIENCETSAIGRALGIAGFGIDTSIASAEEVQNAMANQETKSNKKTTIKNDNEKLELIVKLSQLVNTKKIDYEKLLSYYGVTTNSDMTVEQLQEAIKTLESREDK